MTLDVDGDTFAVNRPAIETSGQETNCANPESIRNAVVVLMQENGLVQTHYDENSTISALIDILMNKHKTRKGKIPTLCELEARLCNCFTTETKISEIEAKALLATA